jgi:hypothetical protein
MSRPNDQLLLNEAGDGHGNVAFHANIQRISRARGQTMATSEPFEFANYRRPQFERPLSRPRVAQSDGDQMPPENLSDLLGRVSENSTGEIDSLIGEFERLRQKLQTDGDRIQREIEEYNALSQQVMQLTEAISESVKEVRASVDQPREE